MNDTGPNINTIYTIYSQSTFIRETFNHISNMHTNQRHYMTITLTHTGSQYYYTENNTPTLRATL